MGHDLSKDILDYEEREYTCVGRQNEVNEIKEMLKKRNIVQIYGMTKLGKSRVLMQLLKQFYISHTCFYHDFEGSVENEEDVKDLAEKFQEELQELVGGHSSIESSDVESAVRSLLKKLKSCSTKLKDGILFMDNVEKAFESKNVKNSVLSFLRQIGELKADSLKVVFTTSDKVGLISSCFGEFEIGRMQDVHIDTILRTIIQQRGEQVDSFNLAEKILGEENEIYIQTIVKQCEGLPMAAYMVATELTADEGLLTPRDMVQLLMTQRVKSLSLEYYPPEDRLDLYKRQIENVRDLDIYFFLTLNKNFGTDNRQKIEHLWTEMTKDNDRTRLDISKCFKLLTQPCIIKYLGKTEQLVMHGIFRECIFQITGTDSIDDETFRSLLLESAKRFDMDLTDKEVENPRLLEEYVISMGKRDSIENGCSFECIEHGTESAVTKLEKHDDTEDIEKGTQLNIPVDDTLHTEPDDIQHTDHITLSTKCDSNHSSLEESGLASKRPIRYDMNDQNEIKFCCLNQNMKDLKCLDSIDDNNAVLSIENDSRRVISDIQTTQTGLNLMYTETAVSQSSLLSADKHQAMSYSVNIMSNDCAMNDVNEPSGKLSNNNRKGMLHKPFNSVDSIENNEDQPWETICFQNENSPDSRMFPVLDEESVHSSTENSEGDSTVPVFSSTCKEFVMPYCSSPTIESIEDNGGQPCGTTFSNSEKSLCTTLVEQSQGFECTREPVEHNEEENNESTRPKSIEMFESYRCSVS